MPCMKCPVSFCHYKKAVISATCDLINTFGSGVAQINVVGLHQSSG